MNYFKNFVVFSFGFLIFAVTLKLYNFDISYVLLPLKKYFNVNNLNEISDEINDEYLFTSDELKEYNGVTRKELYIAILGIVYDVSRSEKHYGPGKSYNIFTGRDASRSFITGNFDLKDASDEVANLSFEELLSLKQWQSFYEKEYTRKGKLVGRYYDASGQATPYARVVERLINEAEERKNEKDLDEQLYPGCNIEWSAESGTRVWCTSRSGGVERSWSGYPRKYYKPGSDAHRCACVEDSRDSNANMVLYDNCDISSQSCNIS